MSHKSYFHAPFSKNLAFSPKKAYNSLGKPKRQGNNFGGQNNGLYYNFSRQKRIIRWLHHGRPQRRFGFGAFHGQKVRGRAAGGAPGRLSVGDLPCGGAAARPCAADDGHAQRGGRRGHLGGSGCQCGPCGHDGYRDHHVQPARSGCRSAGGVPARQRGTAGSARRHWRGGHRLPRVALYPHGPRGRGAPGRAAPDVRHL